MLTAPRGDLRESLAQVPDPRGRKGRRPVFAATLTAVVCAILQNCRGDDALGQWLSKQPLDFLHALGFWRTANSLHQRTMINGWKHAGLPWTN